MLQVHEPNGTQHYYVPTVFMAVVEQRRAEAASIRIKYPERVPVRHYFYKILNVYVCMLLYSDW